MFSHKRLVSIFLIFLIGSNNSFLLAAEGTTEISNDELSAHIEQAGLDLLVVLAANGLIDKVKGINAGNTEIVRKDVKIPGPVYPLLFGASAAFAGMALVIALRPDNPSDTELIRYGIPVAVGLGGALIYKWIYRGFRETSRNSAYKYKNQLSDDPVIRAKVAMLYHHVYSTQTALELPKELKDVYFRLACIELILSSMEHALYARAVNTSLETKERRQAFNLSKSLAKRELRFPESLYMDPLILGVIANADLNENPQGAVPVTSWARVKLMQPSGAIKVSVGGIEVQVSDQNIEGSALAYRLMTTRNLSLVNHGGTDPFRAWQLSLGDQVRINKNSAGIVVQAGRDCTVQAGDVGRHMRDTGKKKT
jgi:hypothetical protein